MVVLICLARFPSVDVDRRNAFILSVRQSVSQSSPVSLVSRLSSFKTTYSVIKRNGRFCGDGDGDGRYDGTKTSRFMTSPQARCLHGCSCIYTRVCILHG